jgi:hypothetical protein
MGGDRVMDANHRINRIFLAMIEPETKNEILRKGSTTLSPGKEEDEVSDGYSDEGEFEDYGCDMSGV